MRSFLYSLVFFSSFSLTIQAGSAFAFLPGNQFQDQISQIENLSDTIAGIVAAMTSVAILPMGISSAMKCFRHIVLNNV